LQYLLPVGESVYTVVPVAHSVDPLDFTLDRKSEVPLGTQLVWKLRAAIGAGRLAPGEQLPGVRELAEQAAVNVNTARAVYGRLADQGVIVSRHGLGTFVSDTPLDEGQLRRLAERAAEEAARLGVDPRELAAALFAQPPRPSAADPADRRRAVRERIEALEADVASLEQELNELGAELEPFARPARRRAARPRILTVAELEAVADELAARAGERRHQLAEARQHDRLHQLDDVAQPHSVADTPPDLTMAGATWTLRWKA
jgi:DNA-binding transcriptional regulator YhcF (GntR family)